MNEGNIISVYIPIYKQHLGLFIYTYYIYLCTTSIRYISMWGQSKEKVKKLIDRVNHINSVMIFNNNIY